MALVTQSRRIAISSEMIRLSSCDIVSIEIRRLLDEGYTLILIEGSRLIDEEET
jgi:hypothetical protein